MKKSSSPFGQTQPSNGSKLFAPLTGITIIGFLALVLSASTASAQINTTYGISAISIYATGSDNAAFGAFALSHLAGGYENTATGHSALTSNAGGSRNTANGCQTMYYTTGDGNTANGYQAMFLNTTGGYNNASGYLAMLLNTTGGYNTANGAQALYNSKTGYFNTASGALALYANIGGHQNTAIGTYTLSSNTTGSNNTGLGYGADVSASNLSNATAIGYDAIVNASNKVRIGNTSVTSIGGQVGWTTFSDGRYKKEVKENVVGLAFINSLRPVTYTVNVAGLNEYFNKDRKQPQNIKDDISSATLPQIIKNNKVSAPLPKASEEVAQAAEEAGRVVYDGFIAQEVEAAAARLGIPFSGVDKPKSKDGLYGLRYDNFVVPLVKAVQELSKMNDEKEARIDALQRQIDELKALMVTKGQPVNSSASPSSSSVVLSSAALEQNSPNPFDGTTIIPYHLPQSFTAAQIVISDQGGRVLSRLNVSGAGKGSLKVDAVTLAAGAYNYSLVVDGKVVGSKRMVVAR